MKSSTNLSTSLVSSLRRPWSMKIALLLNSLMKSVLCETITMVVPNSLQILLSELVTVLNVFGYPQGSPHFLLLHHLPSFYFLSSICLVFTEILHFLRRALVAFMIYVALSIQMALYKCLIITIWFPWKFCHSMRNTDRNR